MTRLTWDAIGERYYESGIDRGVLYVNNTGVAWPGLVSVAESSSGGDAKPYYIDGYKYLNVASAEEFEATIEAFSSPAEFAQCDGVNNLYSGLLITQQPRKSFSFSYRTKVGNDLEGLDHAYKIHLVYGALAAPSERTYTTVTETSEAPVQSWSVTTLPPKISGFRPTAHFVIDSRTTPKGLLTEIENALYGSSLNEPRLLAVAELINRFASSLMLRLVPIESGAYEIYQSDVENASAFIQPTSPTPTEEPILWLDTSAGDYAVPILVTGD